VTGGEVVTDPTPGLHLAVLGVAESPVRCERDPPDLLRGGPPRGLSSQLPCRVSTLGDGPLTFCDNPLQGSFRLHPLWVMGVSGPAVHRQLSRTGGGALPGVSQTRAPGGVSARARPQNAQPEYGQAMTELWQRRAVDAATRSRELARATAQIYAEGALMYRRLAASYASSRRPIATSRTPRGWSNLYDERIFTPTGSSVSRTNLDGVSRRCFDPVLNVET